MNWKRLLRILMAFLTALAVIGPAAYLLIAIGIASALNGAVETWVVTVVIMSAIILSIVIVSYFTLREARQSNSENKKDK